MEGAGGALAGAPPPQAPSAVSSAPQRHACPRPEQVLHPGERHGPVRPGTLPVPAGLERPQAAHRPRGEGGLGRGHLLITTSSAGPPATPGGSEGSGRGGRGLPRPSSRRQAAAGPGSAHTTPHCAVKTIARPLVLRRPGGHKSSVGSAGSRSLFPSAGGRNQGPLDGPSAGRGRGYPPPPAPSFTAPSRLLSAPDRNPAEQN